MPRKKAVDPESRGAEEIETPPVPDHIFLGGMGQPMPDVSVRADSTEALLVQNAPVETVDKYPKYPHLENLARYDAVMHVGRVTVQEKLDGCNVRFGLTASGEFWCGSRNQVLDLEDFTASYGFVGWIADQEIESRLRREWVPAEDGAITLYGEWVGRKVQGRIRYPEEGFYLFDIRADDDLLAANHVDIWAGVLGLNTAPRLYVGAPDLATFVRLRDAQGIGGVSEGIVIKAEPPRRDERGDWVIAKFKGAAFEEVAKAKKKVIRDPKDTEAAEAFVEKYVTLERLRHVFAQVREEGADPADVTSTGLVLRAMHADIVREGLPDYQELDQTNQKAIGKFSAQTTKRLIDQLLLAEREEAA